MGLIFFKFIIGQLFFGGGIINLDKSMAGIENMVFGGELNSGNLDKKIDLIKDKLFIYLLAN